jgi:cation diffusion facilitator CzcD-associated flavoprotein CzcO
MNTKTNIKNNRSIRPDGVHPVIIVGAGLNGLAAAYELKIRGIEPVILDGAKETAAPWRKRHEGLRLNTHRLISHLPGKRIPRCYGAFPRRDDMVDYLDAYERSLGVPVHRGVWIERIDRAPEGWRLSTSSGVFPARQVIVATGHERVPSIPDWPGREGFEGELIHAAHFGRADRFRGKRVLVVGAGNSGTDVLNHLVREGTAALWVSVRNGPTVLPTRALGMPLQLLSPLMAFLPAKAVDGLMSATERIFLGNLRKYGIPKHPDGVATRLIREGVAPAFDNGFVAALKAGRVTALPSVARFDGEAVILADGASVKPDVVICATGYRPGLEGLVGHLGVLDENGQPTHPGPLPHPDHAGLWFMGMTPRLPGVFHAARGEARQLARAVLRGEKRRSAMAPQPALSTATM